MKTENLVNVPWDDMVFESRNKAYGAYVVRQDYNGNLAKGLTAAVTIGVLLFIAPMLFSFKGDDVVDAPDIPSDGTIIFEQQPFVIPPPQLHPPVTQRPTVRNLPVHVTTANVADVDVLTVDDLSQSTTLTDAGNTGLAGDGPPAVVIDVPVVEPVPAGPVIFAEVMPAYEGGMDALYKFVRKEVRYPSGARRVGIEGTVYVSFVVNRDGEVVDVKTIKGISADCDKEAERVIAKLPHWTAGMQNHRPVSVRMTLPIKFQLAH